jgi:hypothetical protein
MYYFLLIYLNNKPLYVSSRLAAHHQEDQLCINSNWYSHAVCWLAAGRILPAAYYWNKLIENSASYWFILYGCCSCYKHISCKFSKREALYITSGPVFRETSVALNAKLCELATLLLAVTQNKKLWSSSSPSYCSYQIRKQVLWFNIQKEYRMVTLQVLTFILR